MFKTSAMSNVACSPATNQPAVWDHHHFGNVQTTEICYFSVTSRCVNEEKGCPRLHAKHHYHWQISENFENWVNLPRLQVEALETAFCFPAETRIILPPFLKTGTAPVNVVERVMSHKMWIADFEQMSLESPESACVFHLRRLCTEKNHETITKSSNFQWFFCDANSNWVEYGKHDTCGNFVCNPSINSSQIEQHFLSMPHLPLTYQMSQNTYVIDFKCMQQTNNRTGFQRKIRRRPEYDCSLLHFHTLGTDDTMNLGDLTSVIKFLSMQKTNASENAILPQSVNGDSFFSREFPSIWEPMHLKERVCRVKLSPSSREFKAVVNYLKQYFSPKLEQVERIQHPFLWQALKNKIIDMMRIYDDLNKVNIQWLFHGTTFNAVDSIIKDNFDWRLHGTRVGQIYGRGTYFTSDACMAYNYCTSDFAGCKYLFLARVAVGTITAGNPHMVRPPLNPNTGQMFDSTGTDTVIVKYDKQEYYPEYLITFS
ncbi:hypothetical protein SK128_016802 [Halocaridina rubra]|uniref:Poly [ADP-ribose] polymerase n=1 Tax=Halocaridina rubra TaxID=373956 RepID=A0AAN8XAS0_HALRR